MRLLWIQSKQLHIYGICTSNFRLSVVFRKGSREKDMATVHVSPRAKFLRDKKLGHSGDSKETQGAIGTYPDSLLFPSVQILMRLGNCFNKKAHCFQGSPEDFLSPFFSFFPHYWLSREMWVVLLWRSLFNKSLTAFWLSWLRHSWFRLNLNRASMECK